MNHNNKTEAETQNERASTITIFRSQGLQS